MVFKSLKPIYTLYWIDAKRASKEFFYEMLLNKDSIWKGNGFIPRYNLTQMAISLQQ